MRTSLARSGGAVIGAAAGFYIAVAWLRTLGAAYPVPPALTAVEATGIALGAALGCGLAGWRLLPEAAGLCRRGLRTAEQRLVRLPGPDILAGAVGTIVGLIIALLLSPALGRLPVVGGYVASAVTLLFAGFGWAVFVRKREDLLGLLPGGEARHSGAQDAPALGALDARLAAGRPKVLDTSAIIDGRIADLYRTGFLDGDFVVSPAVLDELRHIADSTDPLRRQRGRHGLQVLSNLQKELHAPVVFTERDPAPELEVDNRLVLLAQELGAHVVTTDYNLNKIAEIQGVPVLNVNELANALKARFLPGEALTVKVVEHGKQLGQGVGYLEDGTMVVIEDGRRFLNEDIEVEVTNSLQKPQGQMIFARPRAVRGLERVGPV